MSTTGHAIRLIAAVLKVMAPNAMIMLPHGREINGIPRLPINKLKHPIKEDTAPVSPRCCSSIMFAAGGRRQLPAAEAGRMHKAKTEGCRFPSQQTSGPLAAIMTKQARIMCSARKRRDTPR